MTPPATPPRRSSGGARPAPSSRLPLLSRLARAPAVQALLIQCAAFPLMLCLVYGLASFRFPINYFAVVFVQGGLAALLTWKFGLARWWRPIQLLFPAALLGAGMLQLPSWLFGLLFLVLLGWYWSTFRSQVPYYPSNLAVWRAVARLMPPAGGDSVRPPRMIDIGSGLGGLVLHLARLRPDVDCQGIELAPLPWLVSRLRAALAGAALRNVRFTRGDYEVLDFAQFDLVFAYLSPAAMAALWRKAAAELRPGAMLLSYEFEIDARPPDQTILTTEGGPPLYVWYF